jgi:transcriptional regulator with XRE-family HTH domain
VDQRKKQVRAEIFARALELEILERGAESGWDLSEEALVGILLKTTREFRGMSQRKLAKASGVERLTILDLEAGRHRPQKKTVSKLATALRVPEAQLDPRQVFRYVPGQLEKVVEQIRQADEADEAHTREEEKAEA